MSSQPPTSGSMAAPSGQGTGYEDIDSFINYDPTVSPTVNTGAHSTPTAGPSSSMMQPSNSQHSFPAPTHQYDQHKQQTGLVMGAIASTLAVNQGSNVSFGRNSGLPTFNSTDFFGFAPDEEMINFNTTPAPGMYMEFDTPTQESISTLFYPPEHSMSSSSYINPTAMGGQETASPVLSTHGNVGRLYPGMHQQQAAAKAAQAHAQAQARRQQLLRQQTQNQQRIQAVQQMPQQPLPSNMTHNPNDPMVQETISHLLSSMRQSSVVSSNDDEGATPSASNMLPHIARSKKDEEDMDEDERLLASEEGKKLSSKERRQLRNKVSARAFRSRRKEYIGQLEAEIAAKTSEANDLRVKNRALLDENTRLSDLTRMLLSSPQFQDFIQTMSTNNPQISQTLQQQLNGHPLAEKDVKPNPHKDVNPYQAQQSGPQTGPLVGMAMVPEPSLDFSNMNMQPTTWAGMAPGAFASNRPQVFSVLELPQGPAVDSIDTTALSGKTSGSHTPLSTFTSEVKDQLPELPLIPRSDSGKTESVSCEEMAEYDPEFPLYAASPEPSMGISSGPREPVFGNILPEKALARYELVSAKATTDSEVSTVTMARFEYLCRSMDVTFERIGRVTAHLPTQ